MQLFRWTHWRPFVQATKQPVEVQTRLLRRLVHRNCDTRFGREHGFSTINSYADFAAAVPIQTYETLRSYIEDQERTGEPALNAAQPVMYARTSGTTGEAKLIPILQDTIQAHKRSQAIQSYVQFSADARAYYGRCLAIVSPAEEGALDSGTPYGSTSGFMYENMPALARMKYVLPYQVFGIADYDLKYLLILRLAVNYRDVTHVACANPSTLVKLLSVLADNRATLLQDVIQGTFSRANDLSGELQAIIAPLLSCLPARVAELRTVFASPRPTFADLWPELRLVSTWTGGSCRIPLAKVRPTLPSGTRVCELGYLASELRGTLVPDLDQDGGTPTIHENFFEFVERNDWDAGRRTFYLVDQIQQGKEYYIIPTTGTGLYRYFMNDIVRVTGSFHATPTIEFVQKGKGVTNITGEKLYESQVIEAVR
ncbi:MAG TPA: GH3 auxin-responsive promoter family protein, partial [Acidobacteria bacterium]|nr:GH3 auxin-responsive promoter family protein [Acidobacteriota bacterium]